jgi:hypothetical protein
MDMRLMGLVLTAMLMVGAGVAQAKDNNTPGGGVACGAARYILDHADRFSDELVEKAEDYYYTYCTPPNWPDGD